MSLNKVVIIGRLTRDPLISYSQNPNQNQTCVARYTVAVDRPRRRDSQGNEQNNEADFISCVAFGYRAEFARDYLRKGSKISVLGHLQTGSYVNRDNVRVYTTDVVVENNEFCESKITQFPPQNGYYGQGQAQAAAGYQNTAGGGGYNAAQPQNPAQNQPYNGQPSQTGAGSHQAPYQAQQNYAQTAATNMQGLQNNPQPSQPQSEPSPDVFMNIPDGVDEELPFM